MTRRKKIDLPEVTFSDLGDTRYLHLGHTDWIQGSMRMDEPYRLDLEYVQRMMAWLLFVDPDRVPKLQAMQLGLGAASLTKFCFKQLRMATTAIELNPQVIAACRLWFKLPADSARLQVILGDAAEVAAHDHWADQVDALQVDLYDHEAAGPVLDSADFYAGCRHLLTEDGVMTVNLFGRHASFEQSVQTIADVFGQASVWVFKPTREGNAVVVALRTPQSVKRNELMRRAQEIESRWSLPASKWLRVFKPLVM